MLYTHDVLRRRLLAPLDWRPVGLTELARTEWSPQFERYMRNRLAVGAFRYGRLLSPDKPAWDRIAGMEKRIAQYRRTGNTECLVDVANMALLEFCEGRHPLRHFTALSGDHTCSPDAVTDMSQPSRAARCRSPKKPRVTHCQEMVE